MNRLHASSSRAAQEHICCGAFFFFFSIHHQLMEWVRGCPRRLPRDPPATDDRPTEVPPGEGGGAAGLLPAAERHSGGAVQERRGEEHVFSTVLMDSIALSCLSRSDFPAPVTY